MIQIPRRHPTDLPKEPGYYLVSETGLPPYMLPWRKGQGRWKYEHSVGTPAVIGWDGPVKGVPDDLGDVA